MLFFSLCRENATTWHMFGSVLRRSRTSYFIWPRPPKKQECVCVCVTFYHSYRPSGLNSHTCVLMAPLPMAPLEPGLGATWSVDRPPLNPVPSASRGWRGPSPIQRSPRRSSAPRSCGRNRPKEKPEGVEPSSEAEKIGCVWLRGAGKKDQEMIRRLKGQR